MNKAVKLILLLVGFLLLVFLIYSAGLYNIIQVISQAKLHLAFLGVLVYLVVIFIRSLKWFLLARVIKKEIVYKRFIPFYLVNSLMGNITPFKSGEVVTPFLFKKYLKIPVGQGFSIVILDRFFELIIFITILALSVLYLLSSGIQGSLIWPFFLGVLIILFLIFVFLLILIISKRTTFKVIEIFSFLRKYSLSKRILIFLKKELDIFYQALTLFKDKRIYRLILCLTLLGWFFDILAYYLVFRSVFDVPFLDVASAQIIAAGATLITFIPGGLGIAEGGAAGVLHLLGYPLVLSVSGMLLIRLFLTGTLLITGLIGVILIRNFFPKYSVRLKQ